MNVLITGGYGFIGSHVAERFYKEDNRIFIIDNLTNGSSSNIDFKHKFYKMDVESANCEEVFSMNNFDVVVHLAAQTSVSTSVEAPHDDTVSNIMGLVNMLNLSVRYGVKRFIFASSAAVYGSENELPIVEESETNPTSPYGVSKLAGELYCYKWKELFGLNTVTLRVSDVYGPKMAVESEGSVVGAFLKNLSEGQPLAVYGGGEQTRDFIYVEDLVDAIYRCVESDYTGVMNVSTNTERTINELIGSFSVFRDEGIVQYIEPRQGDIQRSCLDNAKVKRELDWVPMYTLEEGMSKTLKWFSDRPEKVKKKPESTKTHKLKKVSVILSGPALPFIENIALFIIVIFAESLFLSKGDYYFIDLKLIYIILTGIVYGTKNSILSVILASFLYIYSNLNYGMDFVSLFYDSTTLIHIAYYLFAGFVVGYSIELKNRTIASQLAKIDLIEEKFRFINTVYKETKNVKDELQKQIRTSEDSFGKMYSIIKDLDTLATENIFTAAVEVIERIMKVKGVAIYAISANGSFARLVANSRIISSNISKSLRVEDNVAIKAIINTKDVFINKKLDQNLPMMMAPIFDKDKLVSLVTVQNFNFDNINLYYENLFKVVTNLISSSLSRAYRYEEATSDSRYIKGTAFLREESFDDVLENKIKVKERDMANFALLAVDAEEPLEELSYKLSNAIRDVDYMGLGKDNKIYIILSNTSETDASIVTGRLAQKGIKVTYQRELR